MCFTLRRNIYLLDLLVTTHPPNFNYKHLTIYGCTSGSSLCVIRCKFTQFQGLGFQYVCLVLQNMDVCNNGAVSSIKEALDNCVYSHGVTTWCVGTTRWPMSQRHESWGMLYGPNAPNLGKHSEVNHQSWTVDTAQHVIFLLIGFLSFVINVTNWDLHTLTTQLMTEICECARLYVGNEHFFLFYFLFMCPFHNSYTYNTCIGEPRENHLSFKIVIYCSLSAFVLLA